MSEAGPHGIRPAEAEGGFLPPRLLDRLGGLDLIARTVVEGFVGGAHRSPYRGAGEEFARHRAYQQGDDVRHLDWRLFARTDRLFVREYREDSNLQAYLVVDATASMGYADGAGLPKLRYAAYLAAALAYLMLRAGDRVGLASYGAAPVLHHPPRNRPGHLHDLLATLERLEPAGDASAAGALDNVGEALRRKGRVVLISDLLEDDDGAALLAALGRLRARGDETIVLRTLTPEEAGDAPLAAGTFHDPERPAREVAASPADDPEYARRVAAYYARLATAMGERGVEYVAVTTARPVELALGDWIRVRGS